MNLFILALFILLNFFILLNYDTYEKFFKIIDKPDGIRKKHKHEVKIFGGMILIINLLLLGILSLTDLSILIFDGQIFNDIQSHLTFFIFTFLFFILGFYDDVFDISANKRLLISSIIFLVALLLNNNLLINSFYIKIIDLQVELGIFSIFFSIFCFLLLLNSLNMFDGINFQAGLFCITIFSIFFLIGTFQMISLIMIISLISYLYLNAKNKIFLGDGGIYILSFIITFILISQNNYTLPFLTPELILQILIIPGIDMVRLFTCRILNKKNPFYPDRQHLHHLLLNCHDLFRVTLIMQSLILIPILLGLYIVQLEYSIMISIIAYFTLVITYKNQIQS